MDEDIDYGIAKMVRQSLIEQGWSPPEETKEMKTALEESRDLFKNIALHCKHTGVRIDACDGQVLINKIINP